MRRRFFLISFGVIAAWINASHAQAQQQTCSDRHIIAERLATFYGENWQSVLHRADSKVFDLYLSPDTGSWTVTATSDDGRSCLVSAGQAFQYQSQPLASLIGGA